MNVRKLVLLLLVSLCSACAALSAADQLNKFDASLNQYGSALRWGNYLEAYSFHIRRDKTQPKADFDKLEKFSIVSFDVLERISNPDSTGISLLVEISYYDRQLGTLRKIKQKQVWWFNGEIKRWLTEADFPDLK